VLAESFRVDRGAAEQELHAEDGRAATAGAVKPMQVLQLGDDTLGVCHSSAVRPNAGVASCACSRCEREPLRILARPAAGRGSIDGCGGMKVVIRRSAASVQTRSAANP
jgi:hypothetical protein